MKNNVLRIRLTINFLFFIIGITFLLFTPKPCFAQSKQSTETYKTYIEKADMAFYAEDYKAALPLYIKASEAKPDYNYATDQIDEIHKILETASDSITKLPTGKMSTDDSYKTFLAKADWALANMDYAGALLLYDKAYQTRPDYYYANDKIYEIHSILVAEPDIKAKLYNNLIHKADSLYEKKNYQQAKNEYQKASLIDTSAMLPKERLEDISSVYIDPEDMANYTLAISNGDKALAMSQFDQANLYYEAALAFHPKIKFVKEKINDTKIQQAEYKEKSGRTTTTLATADVLIPSEKSAVATNPNEIPEPNKTYPAGKTTEINSILTKQKSDAENYAQAIRTGEKAQAAGNYALALSSFEEARKIKPSEVYPVEQINEIKAIASTQQKQEDKYTAALTAGDKLFAEKDYNGAVTAYSQAIELRKNEKYPQDQITAINKIIVDSRSTEDNYKLSISEGDKLITSKDYKGALAAFTNAAALKPTETYPRQRITEINRIIEGIAQSHTSEYTMALEVADKLYTKKVYDQAIDAYEAAAKINPADAYPELQIGRIRKYMSDHAILNLHSEALLISRGSEKKFTFSAIDPGLRKNNYIVIKARSTGNSVPKVYLNYGKDDQKNGGIVLRNLDKQTLSDFLISISIQDKWFREENNWISISVETGAIEITKVQIAAGE